MSEYLLDLRRSDVCIFVETSRELMQTQPIKGPRVTGAKSS